MKIYICPKSVSLKTAIENAKLLRADMMLSDKVMGVTVILPFSDEAVELLKTTRFVDLRSQVFPSAFASVSKIDDTIIYLEKLCKIEFVKMKTP